MLKKGVIYLILICYSCKLAPHIASTFSNFEVPIRDLTGLYIVLRMYLFLVL